jgi:hypothetical protein
MRAFAASRPKSWSEMKTGNVIPSASPQDSCVSSSASEWYGWYLGVVGSKQIDADPIRSLRSPALCFVPLWRKYRALSCGATACCGLSPNFCQYCSAETHRVRILTLLRTNCALHHLV